MATLSRTRLQFYSSRRYATRYWLEGDSYVDVTGSTGVAVTMRANGKIVILGAVGGSTVADSDARVTTDAELIQKCQGFLYWDGRQNGFTNVTDYTNAVAAMIAKVGIPFVVIPACAPFGLADPSQEVSIRDAYVARWPSNTYDWRNNIANTGGIVNSDRMLNYPTDTDHLNQTAHTEAYAGYSALLP